MGEGRNEKYGFLKREWEKFLPFFFPEVLILCAAYIAGCLSLKIDKKTKNHSQEENVQKFGTLACDLIESRSEG